MPRKSSPKRSPTRSPRKSSPKKSSRKPSTRSRRSAAARTSESAQRLQRLLASAGFGSRRQCEELIEAGRVEVDGEVVTKLGTTVTADVSKVRVDGVLLKKQKLVYFAVNKPVGFVTTNRDPHGRPRVIDLVPPDERVFPVGRLDRNSEGLILLTNDGELAQKLTHPKFGVRKVYRVTVAGKVDPETMRQMRKGIYIAEGFVRVEGAKLMKSRSRSTEMEIVLREGKNREIRRILARLGHKVQHLRRIAVGPLRLGDVPSGAYRVLSNQEIDKLWMATETSTDPPPRRRGTKKHAGKRGSTASRRPTKGKKGERRKSAARGADAEPEAASRGSGTVIGGDVSSEPSRTRKRNDSRRSKPTGGKRGSKKRTGRKKSKSDSPRGNRKKSVPTKRGSKKRKPSNRKRKN